MSRPSLSAADYARETRAELQRILGYWHLYAPDPRGGFHGRVDARNRPDSRASKALVLNARILWAVMTKAQAYDPHHVSVKPTTT